MLAPAYRRRLIVGKKGIEVAARGATGGSGATLRQRGERAIVIVAATTPATSGVDVHADRKAWIIGLSAGRRCTQQAEERHDGQERYAHENLSLKNGYDGMYRGTHIATTPAMPDDRCRTEAAWSQFRIAVDRRPLSRAKVSCYCERITAKHISFCDPPGAHGFAHARDDIVAARHRIDPRRHHHRGL